MSQSRKQITLNPDVLQWARERARLDHARLAGKIGVKPERVVEWEETGLLTMIQVDKLAHHTHTPLGFLYLAEPVDDKLPIPDFRTVGDLPVYPPSPDLIDTLHNMQRRQAWMREYLMEEGSEGLPFVGSCTTLEDPGNVASAMRETLGLDNQWAAGKGTWTEALQYLRLQIEEAGVLVVFNGVVGNNTHRKLDPEEFRGFVMVDSYAPLVFINGADYKGAQMFTLIHELAHIWVGEPGVSNLDALFPSDHPTEQLCNAVAAEFLVPAEDLSEMWEKIPANEEPFQYLARRFKVSTIVAARRTLDLNLISRDEFFDFYQDYLVDERRKRRQSKGGGDFWNTQNVRIGRRFGSAIVHAVRDGRLLYHDAYLLTGLKGKTFDSFVKTIGGAL